LSSWPGGFQDQPGAALVKEYIKGPSESRVCYSMGIWDYHGLNKCDYVGFFGHKCRCYDLGICEGIQNALKFLYCLRSDVLDGCLMKPAVTRPETPR